jgi:SpoVK/Ycf46/Vps4 family AAA+-type ATPase
MGRHVAVVTSTARLRDLVVPPPLVQQLDEIIAWHHSSHRVRWEMQLGAGDPIGTGLTCLFSGKSGTGKTFAARCLANELGLNLYRIDLSQVVSKYIGETEKALAQIFDEVEAGHGLLLFDEADALFGRRSEVKDAHDRYANIEVGYLLQRLEVYDGLAVLTTNLQGNMDAAFVRRLRFILQFPAPDRDLRRLLWEQSLPTERWRADELQLDLLADRFQLSGGAIHNIGLAAAHLAAATPSGRITVRHLARATQRELQKSGRPADVAALGQLVEAMP